MQLLVTIYFDIDEHKELQDRDFDRFILEYQEGKYKETILRYFEEMKYSWNDFKAGYKMIMSIETSNLSDLKVYR